MKRVLLTLFLCLAAPATANASTSPAVSQLVQMIETNKNLETIVELKQLPKLERRQAYCLALNIYHEARGSTANDQWGVGFVTMNRKQLKDETVCAVVWEQSRVEVRPKRFIKVGQFSWTTKHLASLVPKENDAWMSAQRKAYLLLHSGEMRDITGGATHFLDRKLVAKVPWARQAKSKRQLGGHTYVKLEEYIKAHEARQVASAE